MRLGSSTSSFSVFGSQKRIKKTLTFVQTRFLMNIYRNLEDFIPLDNAVVTIGTFDGVHVGHQKILSTLKECARNINGETVLLTFFPHPRMILHPEDDSLKLISDLEEKVTLLAKAGIDHLIITPFTRDFSNQSRSEEHTSELQS